MKKNILVLNFSPRSDGNCGHIGDLIQTFYKNSNIRSYLISGIFTPCGTCNYECLKPNVRCPSLSREQAEVFDAICQSDLVYYIIPNFCGMPNALYYAFNERSVGYFNLDRAVMANYMAVRKRFIIVSNTQSNAFKEAMLQQTAETPEVLYMKTSKYGKQSIAGDLMDSAQAQADLLDFLAAACV